ncbi:MAG: HlyD family efflux transporter periplasmic adaptor subunit [Gammaproteobacteria bacterium]|nr:HlyD family efflux transporter periplasmic adaptor subunit [Gammaproteobacteria bacterium]
MNLKLNGKMFRRAALLLLALLVAGAIIYAYWPAPVEVSVTKVSRGAMQVAVEEEGQTRVRERYIVAAPVAAYAPRIELHVGDKVEAHQELAVLEPLPPGVLDVRSRAASEARVAQTQAALDAARKNAEAAKAGAQFAGAELSRLRHLHAGGLISQSALEQAESEAQRTAATLAAANSSIQVAKYDLVAAQTMLRYDVGARSKGGERVPVRSPVAGVVLALNHENEGVVAPGEALITVGDPHALEVVADLLSSDAVRVHPGTHVVFTRWGGDASLLGRVRTVEPVAFTKISALGVEEQRVLVVVDFVSPENLWRRLGDGYRLEARFIVWESSDVLRVPASAVFQSGDGWAVVKVENGRLKIQPVKIGERGDEYNQVLGGLVAGDAVVTYPDDTLRAGERVRIIASRDE